MHTQNNWNSVLCIFDVWVTIFLKKKKKIAVIIIMLKCRTSGEAQVYACVTQHSTHKHDAKIVLCHQLKTSSHDSHFDYKIDLWEIIQVI